MSKEGFQEEENPADTGRHKNELEILHRNRLRGVLLSEFKKAHMKEYKEDPQKYSDTVYELSRKISSVLDAPENEYIRDLAREGKYEEAAKIVLSILEGEDTVQGS